MKLAKYRNNVIIHVLFFVLATMSIVYANERLVADASYYFFKVINYSSFWVEHDRFILVFSQWLPLLGEKLGLSLKALVLLNSFGHVLFFYIIFLICNYLLKDKNAGWVLIFIQIVIVTQGYFVPMFELYYGAALLVLFNAIKTNKSGLFYSIILVILSFFILTAHLYTFFLLAFLFIIVEKTINKELVLRFVPYFILMLAILFFKYISSSEYESGVIKQFIYQLKNKEITFSYLASLLYHLTFVHWKGFTLFILSTSILFYKKNYRLLLIFLLFFAVLLIFASYLSSGFNTSRYNEQIYFPLWFISSFALIYIALEKVRLNLRYVFLSLCVGIGIISIINTRFFTNRLREMNSLIEKAEEQEGTKFFVSEENLKYDANWSYPIESLIFSSLKIKEKSISICTQDDLNFNNNFDKIQRNQFVFRRWDIKSLDELNKSYFNLNESTYQKLTTK